MKAIVIRKFGGPEELVQTDAPTPQPAAGEVLVRVKAASVNPVDYKIRNQTLYFGFLERTRDKIQALATLASRGQVRPVIDSVFPLAKVADAHRKIEQGGMKGKIVIAVD
jgi:NADPH:quinone reductase-like Zn-dependent oxidoreductase